MTVFLREPLTGALNACVALAEIAILFFMSLYLASLHDVNAATGQVLSIRRRQTTVP